MKKVAVALVVLIVLVVGALLVAPSFWDWNGEKGRLAALVKEQTGRDLEIAGDVSLRLLPAPAFSARQVTLANLEGGSEAAMVRLEELQVSIGLLPLLRGELLVKSMTLVKPEVLLEVLEDGRANWQFAEIPPEAATSPDGAESPSVATGTQPVRINSFLIEDGRLRYRDARSGLEETVSGLNAELAADSLAGPFAASGAAVYEGLPVEFDFKMGKLVDGGATAASLSLQLPDAAASGSFVGALSRHQDLRTLRGRLQVGGGDLTRVIAALPFGDRAVAPPGLLAQPFALTAELSASNTEARADAMKVTLGPLSLDGHLAAKLEGEPDFTVSLSAKTVDLDKLLALPPRAAGEAQGDGTTATAPPPAGSAPLPAAEGNAAGGLPRGIAASVELAADALLYRGQTLRQLQMAARLEDGRIDVTKATVQLPGSSDVDITGTVDADAEGLRFSGAVAAESDNLRGLLLWLGVDVAAVPAERLRRMVLTTGLEAAADRVVLRNADLRLDVSRLTGGAAIALRERPGLGLALNIDKVNLDAYLPAQAAAEPSEPQAPAGQAEQAPAAAAPPALGLPLLGRFDANLDLRIGQLTYRGLPFDGLRLDATLQQGGLVVREASVADLVGSRGTFSGSLANVDREPSIDGSLDVSVSTLSRLVKALGLNSGGPLPLESFTLAGAVNGNREELRFDQRLAALGGSLRAAGRLQQPTGAPAVDAAVELDHPDLTVLLRELLRDPAVPAGLGAAAVTGRVAAGGSEVTLSGLEGKLAGIQLLAGELGLSLSGPRPKIIADLTTGDLPLAVLAAPAAKSGAGAGGSTRSAAPTAAGERWSRKPLDLAALRAVDAVVKLNAKAIRTDKLHLTTAVLEAELDDGLLDLRRFTADGYGGGLSVSGKADARDAVAGLQVAVEVTARDVELKGLLGALADTDRFSGPMTLESSLTTRGTSEAALVGALGGSGKLTGTVTAAAKVEEQAGALVLDILGKKVKEIRGVTDSTTVLFSAFAGAPAKVDGSFVVEEGVAQSNDLKVRGRDAVALTTVSVDLPRWLLDSTTDVFRDVDPDNAYLTARLRGPLDEANVAISGQPFQRSQQPPAESPTAGESPAAQEEPQQKPAKPEEILKDGLKNLLKGLGG
ncbi:MAG: AsmA family protein [Kiloniellaceae bacterium]